MNEQEKNLYEEELPPSGTHEPATSVMTSVTPAETDSQITRQKIALDTLERYSGSSIDEFQKFILLTNFPHYVDVFSEQLNIPIKIGSVLKAAHSPQEKISIIDFRVGAPLGALIIDVLSYTKPQAVVMLGLCGGLHYSQNVGDFILPMAAIRDEGASIHYMPSQVPSLPAFLIQKYISEELMVNNVPFKTGVVHSTDYRMWEFDDTFKERLRSEKASIIDMECSALFTTGFARKVPVGALMLISDLPLLRNGIKTKESARAVFDKYSSAHIDHGLNALRRMVNVAQTDAINFRRFHF